MFINLNEPFSGSSLHLKVDLLSNLTAPAAGLDLVPVADGSGILASVGSSVVETGHSLTAAHSGTVTLVAVDVVL